MRQGLTFWTLPIARTLVGMALVAPVTVHAQAPAPSHLFIPPDVDTVNGAIGVCVRWTETDLDHVSDVVIAQQSGDARIDAEAPAVIRSIPWRAPDGYDGEWVGVSLSFTGAPPRPQPDCEALLQSGTAPVGGA